MHRERPDWHERWWVISVAATRNSFHATDTFQQETDHEAFSTQGQKLGGQDVTWVCDESIIRATRTACPLAEPGAKNAVGRRDFARRMEARQEHPTQRCCRAERRLQGTRPPQALVLKQERAKHAAPRVTAPELCLPMAVHTPIQMREDCLWVSCGCQMQGCYDWNRQGFEIPTSTAGAIGTHGPRHPACGSPPSSSSPGRTVVGGQEPEHVEPQSPRSSTGR